MTVSSGTCLRASYRSPGPPTRLQESKGIPCCASAFRPPMKDCSKTALWLRRYVQRLTDTCCMNRNMHIEAEMRPEHAGKNLVAVEAVGKLIFLDWVSLIHLYIDAANKLDIIQRGVLTEIVINRVGIWVIEPSVVSSHGRLCLLRSPTWK
jgi:hypothetical protein